MLRLVLLFSLSQIAHGALDASSNGCPAGFDLVKAGQCRQSALNTRQMLVYNVATQTAVTKCQEKGAQPIIIHDSEEYNYWHARYNYYLILGLVCNTTTKKWEWTDGSALDYKPSTYAADLDKDCATGGVWYIYSSGWTISYGTSATTFDIWCTKQLHQPVPSAGCFNFDDDSDDGVCYQIGTAAEDWQDAQMICKSQGANLASVHNANENAFIRRMAVANGAFHGVFLGASVSGKGGNFGWIDGTAWDYDNFFPGFPRPDFGDCVALDTSTTAGQWMNMDCTAKLPVVCIRDKIIVDGKNATCSSQTWNVEETVMTSPGFPFDASMPCEYFIEVDSGKKVELEIDFLEANSCCDYLTVYDGYFGGFMLANRTGEVRNVTYTTSASNFMRVSWQPQGGVNVRGVAMTFRGV